MIRLLDGPAGGQSLACKRAPRLLRVVQDTNGTFDALDQLHDTPSLVERITVYERVTKPFTVHVNAGRHGGSGWYQVADYRVVTPPPHDAEVRSTGAWRAWATAYQQKERVTS